MNIFFILIALYIGGNIYIFFRGKAALSAFPKRVKAACLIFQCLAVLSTFISFFFRDVAFPLWFTRLIYSFGNGWLVFTLYMVLLLAVTDIIGIFRKFRYGFFVSLLLTFSILAYGYYKYWNPVKEEIDITIGKPLKNGLASLKIVALSDLHLGSGSYKNWLQQRVDEINDCKPDLILIGGDLIDNSLVPVRNTVLEDIVNRLLAPMGIYAVPGNHEYFSNVDECRKWLDENTPIRMLRDEVVTLPCGLQIVGRDDRQNRRRLPLERVVEQVNDTLPTVLLDHQPSDLGVAARNNIDLQFSGHTHHGQIWPLTLLTDRLFELSYGFRKIGNTCYYVSSGLGLWGPPFRIGTESEFVVFNISFKE